MKARLRQSKGAPKAICSHVHDQGEMEEELNKSLRSFGVDPASGRLSDAAYAAAAAQLQSRRSKALAARPLSHRERAAHLHSTILWHIHRVRLSQNADCKPHASAYLSAA